MVRACFLHLSHFLKKFCASSSMFCPVEPNRAILCGRDSTPPSVVHIFLHVFLLEPIQHQVDLGT